MDDFYAIVGVDRAASREELDKKIREELRRWQRRTANADLDRRQEAERRVRQLGEARITLLDEEKRREYDHTLGVPPALPAATATSARLPQRIEPTTNWLQQAQGYLARSDYQSAAYAAREALRNTTATPAAAWAVLARADAGLGRLDDALFEARRAVTADPGSAGAHLALAQVREQRREWSEAILAYQEAGRLAPEDEAARVGEARVLARWGRPGSAVERLERHYAATRYASPVEQATANQTLARGLVETAQAVLATSGTSQSGLTAELAQVQRMLDRAQAVTGDLELRRRVDSLQQDLRRRATPRPTRPQRPQPVRPAYGHGQWRTHPRTNPLAVAALILALLGLGTCAVSAPVGAIMGHVARNRIREQGEAGEGMATAAIVIGWIISVIGFCLVIVTVASR